MAWLGSPHCALSRRKFIWSSLIRLNLSFNSVKRATKLNNAKINKFPRTLVELASGEPRARGKKTLAQDEKFIHARTKPKQY
jgi:uncharacterized protein (DUF2252 family)